MASKQEEKARRRQERLEAEQAAQRAADRKRTLKIAGAAALGIAALAIVAVVALAGGGSSDKADTTNLAANAKAAGCTYGSFKSEGRGHSTNKVRYKTNPPTSGTHNPVAAEDGIYAAGNEPAVGNWVHSLEHGRVLFQYRKGTPAADVEKFRALSQEELNGSAGYHTLFFQNDTNMPAQFALVAWTKSLTCPSLTNESMDVMRQFRAAYTDKGPEFIP